MAGLEILARPLETEDLTPDPDQIEVRPEARELLGPAVPYDQPTQIGSYVESSARGAFAGIDAGSVPLTAAHPRNGAELPIGLSTELRESEAGLHGTWRVSRIQLGDEILALASDGVPLGLSIGFIPARPVEP